MKCSNVCSWTSTAGPLRLDGQAGDSLAHRSQDRQVRRGARPRLPDVDRRRSQTGRASYRPNTVPKEGVEFRFCPSTGGFKSLRSMAYHPATRAFYIPLNLTCEDGTFGPIKLVEGGGGSGPVRRINLMHPESPDGLGELLAMDVHGRILRRDRTRTPPNMSALTMGDGLVLEGYWIATSASTMRRQGRFCIQARACRRSFRGSRLRTPSTGGSTSRCPWARAAGPGRAAS